MPGAPTRLLASTGHRTRSSRLRARSLRRAKVRFAQAVCRTGEHLAGESRHLIEQRGKVALPDDNQLHVGVGNDGRIPGGVVEKCELPKPLPGPRVAILRPWRSTLAVPSMITKNSVPFSPSFTIAIRAVTCRSSDRRASVCRSLREHAENSATCCM